MVNRPRPGHAGKCNSALFSKKMSDRKITGDWREPLDERGAEVGGLLQNFGGLVSQGDC